jgi:iron complex outermembrane receptor protein
VYYSTDFGFGLGGNGSTLNISFNGTYLDKYDVTPVADLADRVDVCKGSYGVTCLAPRPEYQWNSRATWMSGNWTVSGLVRYIGESKDDVIENLNTPANTLAAPKIDGLAYLDLTLAYAFDQGLYLSLGGTNILDEKPDKLGSVAEQANTFPSTYPLFGPRVFVSASYKF